MKDGKMGGYEGSSQLYEFKVKFSRIDHVRSLLASFIYSKVVVVFTLHYPSTPSPLQHRQWPRSSQSATSPSAQKPANQSSRSVPSILGDSQLTCVRDVEPKPRCRRGGSTRTQGSKRERQDDALEVSCRVEYLSGGGDSVSWQVSWR
jgi:hypothetical protein